MADYYNEIDPFCAEWLRRLVAAGELPAGDVDTRSITDVRAADLAGYTQCHFFAGIGGWPLALGLAGWPSDRQVWTASLPCQPFSSAGLQRGFADERHLWPVFRELVAECAPAGITGEQVASAAGREWFDQVRADLEALGYAVGGADLCAAGAGAHHIRQRLYWTAHAQRDKQPRQEPRRRAAGRMGRFEQPLPWHADWRGALAWFRALGDGVPRRVEATDAARNAIYPPLAAKFIEAVMEAA